MSLATILAETQDHLLLSGDTTAMTAMFPDVLRAMGRQLPIWAEIQVQADVWYAGSWVDATQTYTDATAAAQSTGSFALSTLTANSGILIGAAGLFGQVVFSLSQAHVGGTPVYEYSYWNGQLWRVFTPSQSPNFGVTATPQTLQFSLPGDWVRAIPPGVTFSVSFNPEQFWLRVRVITPPATTAAVASLVTVVRSQFLLPSSALQLLSAHYMPRELEPVLLMEAMDLLDPLWQTRSGTPTRYSQDSTPTTQLQVIPTPTGLAATGIPPFSGLPGAVSSTNYLVTLFLDTPRADLLPDWFEGLVALSLAAREAQRQGEVMDPQLAQSLMAVVGLVIDMLRTVYKEQGMEFDVPWTSGRIVEVLT
jgi:hypothetical protein